MSCFSWKKGINLLNDVQILRPLVPTYYLYLKADKLPLMSMLFPLETSSTGLA